MTQNERMVYLLHTLLHEQQKDEEIQIPEYTQERKRLLCSLMNIRPPMLIEEKFLQIQDEYLQSEMEKKGIVDMMDILPVQNKRYKDKIYLWQGDITSLKVDAIVNAANSKMLGCFVPCHGCIDNAIHTCAGIQLRLACAEIMKKQGEDERTGTAKITPAYNLPSKYILHTVGPIVSGELTQKHEQELESCYTSCLKLAVTNQIKSIAFCCISTGEFHFPNEKAAQIAIQTVQNYLSTTQSEIKVIFNVFKENDYQIYRELLGADS